MANFNFSVNAIKLLNAVGTTAGVFGDSIDFLGKYVSEANNNLEIEQRYNSVATEERIMLQVAELMAETTLNAQEYRAKSTAHASAFDQSLIKLEAVKRK